MHKKYQLIIVGGGAGGIAAATRAAALGIRTALIEKNQLGGDCLNTGSIPSKAMIRTAQIASLLQRSRSFGIDSEPPTIDFARVIESVGQVHATLSERQSVPYFRSLGLDVFTGNFRFTEPRVMTNGYDSVEAKRFIIATGSRPFIPQIPWMEQVQPLTTDTVWGLPALPKQLIVLGGGGVGCELAQTFARLGSQVQLVEAAPRLLSKEDWDAGEFLQNHFREENIQVLTHTQTTRVQKRNNRIYLDIRQKDSQQTLEADQLLVAIGRRPNTTGLDLEKAGIQYSNEGITVNAKLQTTAKHIYACGDVCGPHFLSHVASYQAHIALHNAFFPLQKNADYRVIPWCTFTDPEVAHVGQNEQEAKEKNLSYDVYTYPMENLDRAVCNRETAGFLKVLTTKRSDQILGATLIGSSAGDLIHLLAFAMQHHLGLQKILETIHIHPTTASITAKLSHQWERTQWTPGKTKLLQKYLKLFF